jgi:hypothetical protein
MLSPAKPRLVLPVVLGVVSLALFVRGVGYYWGSGPGDGEDLPSFVTFLAASAVLFVAVLVSWRPHLTRRGLWITGLCVSGLLLLMTFGWWALNVELERWAS